MIRKLLVKNFALYHEVKTSVLNILLEVVSVLTAIVMFALAQYEIMTAALLLYGISKVVPMGKQKYISYVRCGKPIFAMFIIVGIVWSQTFGESVGFGDFSWYHFALLGVLLIFLFCGFVYFGLCPVKWEELDAIQKIYYTVDLYNPITEQKDEVLDSLRFVYPNDIERQEEISQKLYPQ